MRSIRSEKHQISSNQLQSNRMFFWWELCKLPPQHWYLIDSLSRASCDLCKQVDIGFVPFSNIIWKAVCESKFLLWLMMANIHYHRTTKLERREKIISLITEVAGLSPQTLSNFLNRLLQRRIYLESRVGRNEQFLPMTLLNLWNTLNLLSLAVMLQKSGKHSLGTEYVRPTCSRK